MSWKAEHRRRIGEIALDRLFAENRELKIGDSVVLGGEKLEIVGTVHCPIIARSFRTIRI